MMMTVLTLLLSIYATRGCVRNDGSGNPKIDDEVDEFGRVYFCVDRNMDMTYHEAVAEAVHDYNTRTDVRLYHSCDDSKNYVPVKAEGRNAWIKGENVSLNDNFGRLSAKAIHEFGHVWGFCHEHTRSDRDDHSGRDRNCEGYYKTTVNGKDGNDYEKLSSSEDYRANGNSWWEKYDCTSIMHYWKDLGAYVELGKEESFMWWSWWSWTDDIGRYTLSWSDIQRLNDLHQARITARNADDFDHALMPWGDYSYLMPRSGCSDGFEEHWLRTDDEDDNNENTVHGDFFKYLTGDQDRNTLLGFCLSHSDPLQVSWLGWSPGSGLQECEGDCDNNDDCSGNLQCFHNGIPPGCEGAAENSAADYCYDPDQNNLGSGHDWPAGTYCIMAAADGSCPNGFQSGYRYQDNEDDGNINSQWGHSSGFSGSNSEWRFCCRADGSQSNHAVLHSDINGLPIAFTTFRKGGQCQEFQHYQSGVNVWIYWDDEDSNNNNQHSGSLPDGQYDRNTKFQVCVHRKSGESDSNFEQHTEVGPNDHRVINLDDPELDPEPFAFRFRIGTHWIVFQSVWQPVMALAILILSVVSMVAVCVHFKRGQRGYVAVKYMDSELDSDAEVAAQPINN